MNAAKNAGWLGYLEGGGRLELDRRNLLHGTAVLGRGARDVAASLAYCLNEASMKVTVVDLDGSLSRSLSGHLNPYDASYVLHDSLLLEENAQFHALLMASAYSTVMDLPLEQEALLNAVIQAMAMGQGEASPSAIVSDVGAVEGFKGPEKMELSGRMGTLRMLDSAGEAGAVKQVVRSGCIVDFAGAKNAELAEVTAALFVAKVLSAVDGAGPEVLVLGEAQRIFRSYRIPRHRSTLRSALLASPFGTVFSSSIGHALDRHVVDACSTRIYSSEIWNAGNPGRTVLPNMFVLQNHVDGSSASFVPREFESLNRERTIGRETGVAGNGLSRAVLEMVGGYDASTRTSVVGYLSAEFPVDAVQREVDRLLADGSLVAYKRAQGTDSPASVLRVTEAGKLLLKELTRDGKDRDPV
jgi:hypothetical protein